MTSPRTLGLWALALGLLSGAPAGATGQAPDTLVIGGAEYPLLCYPLDGFFRSAPDRKPDTDVVDSSLWRGYKARWEIHDGRLRLTRIEVPRSEPNPEWDPDRWQEMGSTRIVQKDVTREVFPDRQSVVGDWYSGHLIVATGELVDYVHLAHASTYQSYRILTVEEGRVVGERRLDDLEFRVFRRSQFLAFEETAEFAEMLAYEMRDGTTREAAREHLFAALTHHYVPMLLPERPRDFVDRMILNQGLWTGRRITSRAGNCAMENARADVKIELRVDELGKLSGLYAAPKPDWEEPYFSGTVSPDGTFRATTSADAFCAGRKRRNVSEWTGAVRSKKRGLELEFRGRSDPCPEMGCKFKVRYRLEAPER